MKETQGKADPKIVNELLRKKLDSWRELDQSAIPGRIRPRIEAAARAERALGHPHLLERRPVVGRSLPREQVAAVRPLEAEVHLQAAVVRRVWIPPRALEVVDARPGTSVRRVLCNLLRPGGDLLPGTE